MAGITSTPARSARSARTAPGLALAVLTCAGVLAAAGTAYALPSKAQWEADVKKAVAPAQQYLKERLPAEGDKPALVLDIDNTSLASEYDEGKPVKPTLELARYAKEHGASVQFVTNRKERGREETRRDLRAAGFPVDGLCMRQKGDDSSKEKMKTACREGIEERGATIVANVGNRDTDLAGGHAERTFKLPDYDGELS
ncbi:HAD family acid phosphatase [Streptomyces sp. ODS28]|uniref:HAD family acid phosphatase n=1 Tax=Streptomyces sp. ODS28 TaxID=3136688 RepID=UPI0031E87969